MTESEEKKIARETLENHLEELSNISLSPLIEENPMMFYIISDSIKSCSVALALIGKL